MGNDLLLVGKKTEVKQVRVAFYMRVSTNDQDKEGYSPEFQYEQLQEHLKRKSYKGWYTKPEWHFYEPISGDGMKRRLELQKLMELVRTREVNLVLVWKIDRLSRRLSDLLALFQEMDKHGVGFASVKEDLDFTGPIGQLIFQIFGALAEFERETIKMRTEEGKRASAKMGNYIGGSIPFGYKPIANPLGKGGKKLEIVPSEARIVEQIFEWYVHEDKSFVWIAKELNRLKVSKGTSNPRATGTPWRDYTVSRMLANEVYRGAYITNRYRLVSRHPDKYEERPKSDWHYEPVDPCIDTVLFYSAQEKLLSATKASKRGGGQHIYMLRSKLVDVQTGKGFVGVMSTKNTRNYRRHQFKDKDGTYHPSINVAALQLEPIVWARIEQALNEPEEFLKLHREHSSDSQHKERLVSQLQLWEAVLSKANKSLEKVDDDFYEENITEDKRDELQVKYKVKQEGAVAKVKELEEELTKLGKYDAACENLRHFAEKFEKDVKDMTYEQKQKLVNMLVERVEISETEDGVRKATVLVRFEPTIISSTIPSGRTPVVDVKANNSNSDEGTKSSGGPGGI